MVDTKKVFLAAGGVTGVTYLLGWLYSKYLSGGLATISFSAIDVNVGKQITSGVDTTLAGKLLSYVSGAIPTGGAFGALITLYVASFVIVWLGAFLADKGFTFGKTDTGRFAVGLTLASGIVGLLVGTMSATVGAIGTAIAMLFYFGIVAFVYSLLRKVDGLNEIFPAP